MSIKKIITICSMCLAFSAFTTFSMPDDSEARRMGGGRSIGRTTSVKPTAPTGSSMTQQRATANQRSNVNNDGTATASRGMFGGMGGIFGGLLAGSLLGSMLGGGGLAGAGGGLLDILLIGGIAYLAFRFFKSRNARKEDENTNDRPQYSYKPNNYTDSDNDVQNDSWAHLRTNPQENAQEDVRSFNEEEFMIGAKQLYTRLQSSWDERDMDDIAHFTTPTLYKDLQDQYKEDPNPSTTEIVLVNGHVVEVKTEGAFEYVTVLFDATLREDQSQESSLQVKEYWHFVRNKVTNDSWKLDGIQTID